MLLKTIFSVLSRFIFCSPKVLSSDAYILNFYFLRKFDLRSCQAITHLQRSNDVNMPQNSGRSVFFRLFFDVYPLQLKKNDYAKTHGKFIKLCLKAWWTECERDLMKLILPSGGLGVLSLLAHSTWREISWRHDISYQVESSELEKNAWVRGWNWSALLRANRKFDSKNKSLDLVHSHRLLRYF